LKEPPPYAAYTILLFGQLHPNQASQPSKGYSPSAGKKITKECTLQNDLK
jgi:hypothetical protein